MLEFVVPYNMGYIMFGSVILEIERYHVWDCGTLQHIVITLKFVSL